MYKQIFNSRVSPFECKDTSKANKIWGGAATDFTNNTLYNCIQFVPPDGDAMAFGSDIQQITCQEIGIPEDFQEDFWYSVGQEAVEEALRRKRSTICGAFKRAFKKECEKEEAIEPPPDPKLFVHESLLKPTDSVGSMREDTNILTRRLEIDSDEEENQEETDSSIYFRSGSSLEAQAAYAKFLGPLSNVSSPRKPFKITCHPKKS